jgi:tripartite-type tricarboxylate transporter receptor subunit TctC
VPTSRRRWRLVASLAATLIASAPAVAGAQTAYPLRTVKIIVPFPAGGANDLAARIIAEPLKARWGQPVIVENHPGAGGNIGADIAAQAAGDGHTLMVSPPGPLVINKSLYRKLAYDPDAFVPVTIINTITNVVVVRPDLGVASVGELIALVRARPGKLTFASQGNGSTPYMTGYMFIALADAPVLHVPYRGEGPALADMLGGHVDMMFPNLTAALDFHRNGRLKILAVADGKRAASLPDVPTMAELGYPAFRSVTWNGVTAPPGTPAALAADIARAIIEVVKTPDVDRQLRALGTEPATPTPAQMAAFMKEERERWSEVIRRTGIALE